MTESGGVTPVSEVSLSIADSAQAPQLRVLIVDDDEFLLQMLGYRIKAENYAVALASNGQEALQKFDEFSPQIVLLDVMMDGMDGLEVCRELRKKPGGELLYIMIFTQHDNNDLLVHAFDAGVDDYIPKPVAFRALNARISAGKRLIKLQAEVERERRNSHRYLDTVDVIIIGLDTSGKLTLVNRKACEVLGYEERDLLHRNWCETFIPANEQDRISFLYNSVVNGRISDLGEFETYIITQDGERRLVSWHNNVMVNQGAVTEILCCGIDITDERTAEIERARLTQELEKAKKTQAIGNLMGGVAHNFNNILAAILGFSELGLAQEADNQAGRSRMLFENIYRSSEEAKNFVESLLFINGSIGRGNEVPLLPPLMADMQRSLSSVLPDMVNVETQCDDLLPVAHVNPDHLHQMLTQLCMNSCTAMGNEGPITLELKATVISSESCNSCHKLFSGSYIQLSVIDQGAGMTTKLIESIFDPYFSTGQIIDRLDGMGLPLVHGIMHACGGHVLVNSIENIGTTFRLLFPVEESGG